MNRTLATMLLALGACAPESVDLARDAAIGHPVSAVVTEQADGSLHADQLLLARARRASSEEIPVEDVPQAVMDAFEAMYPGATVLSAEHEDDEYGIEFLSADGEHLEAEFDGDGNFLEVEPADGDEADDDDDGPDDNDGDGEIDDDERRYRASHAHAFLVGRPAPIDGRDVYALLGLEVNPGPNAVPQGTVRFVGSFNGDGYFSSATVVPAAGDASLIGGISQGIVADGGGWTLTVMDRPVHIDDATRLIRVDDPLAVEGPVTP